MKLRNGTSLWAVGALFSTLAFVGCRDSFKNCEDTYSCPPEGDGDGDSSTGGVGGDGDGDGDGDTGGGGGSGGVGTGGMGTGGDGTGGGMGGDPTVPCMGECTEDEFCNDQDECVDCLTSDHCEGDEETPVCDTDVGSCVECVAAADCEDPTLPMCEGNVCEAGCEVPEDCARFGASLGLCDTESGACVECLTRDDCPGTVCERATNTCIDNRDAGDVGVCEECEYDDDCAEGQLCVEQSFEGTVVGNFCTWRKDGRPETAEGTCSQHGRPFALATAEPVESVEGQMAVLCTLRTTSCPAFFQHSQPVEGCDATGDDDACGVIDVDDGLCRENNEQVPYCTYPCVSDADCRTGSTCPPGDGSYCSL